MSRSPYTASLKWEQGHLNDSSYRAFVKFAAKLFNCYPAGSVLKEVASLIEAAGGTPDKSKLVEQFSSAFAFVANERAAETLGVPELKNQRVQGYRSEGKWPDPEPELIEHIAQEHAMHTLAWWQSISAPASTPADVLPALFPAKSRVCFGTQQNMHFIRPLGDELYKRALTAQYVVPNPAKDYYIEFPDGRRSLKCSENFPARHYVVAEFDRERIDPAGKRSISELLDLQSALHAHLAERWGALALLVFSGNESLHGWYPCVDVDEERVISFLRYGCSLGGDHALSSPSQFTRMPGGRHANGARQTIHFFKAS